MTASPVDAKVDAYQAARFATQFSGVCTLLLTSFSDLEVMLNSCIVTATNMSLLQKAVSRPRETILRYPALPQPIQTSLNRELELRFGRLEVLQPMFEQSKIINSHLGRWCSDFYWTLALAEKKSQKIAARIEKSYRNSTGTTNVDSSDDQIALLQEALKLVHAHTFADPKEDTYDLTAKVLHLQQFLLLYFDRQSEHRCIVFVEQRLAARLLCEVFNRIGGHHLHTGALVGSGSDNLADLNSTFREQVMTLIKFRKGDLNCLFATAVAEEGLDIPDCNLVIRFDVCQTMIKYIQSRGRARHKNSTFVHMIEDGNTIQSTLIISHAKAERSMRDFCNSLPADRHLQGNDDCLPQNDTSAKIYKVEKTGALITYANSLGLLAHFVSSLPTKGDELLHPMYVVTPQAGQFQCEVILPENSPIRGFVGDLCRRKALAKCSAAFEACVSLRKGGYLDENLLPEYKSKLHIMNNAEIGINSNRQDMHMMRTKPTIWQESRGSIPGRLFALFIDIPDGLDQPHQAVLLLSRFPLPQFPSFPLYLDSGRQVAVQTKSMERPVEVSHEEVIKLTDFTLRMFKDIFNKKFEDDPAKMSYWLVPTVASNSQHVMDSINPSDLVDWKSIDNAYINKEFRWSTGMDSSFLEGKFLIDPFDGGRRYFVKRLAPEYKHTDPVPDDAVKNKYSSTILDNSVSLFSKSRQRAVWVADQPVFETAMVLQRRNLLATPSIKEQSVRCKCFVCPEPLIISTVSIA